MTLKIVLSIMAVALIPISSAQANHDGRVAQELAAEAQQLNVAVQHSYLNWSAKDAVGQFAYYADDLARCSSSYGDSFELSDISDVELDSGDIYFPPTPYEPGRGPRRPAPGRPIGGGCDREFGELMRSFNQVDYYLRDSRYDDPGVYSRFLRVENLVRRLRGGGGYPTPPYPQPPHQPPYQLRAIGQMDNVTFNLIGDRYGIVQQCMNLGRRYGLHNVRMVMVNGQRETRGGFFMSLNEACDIVARYAR